MKVTGKTTDASETSVDIDLFEGQKLPARVRARISDEVGNFLVEQTLIAIEQEKSPISGEGKFKALSKDYAKLKKREVGNSRPNLEVDGNMKDEINFKPTKTGVTLGVFGDRAPAADGHNNLSGKSSLPTRRFLPDQGQNYKKDIKLEVERIKADIIAEETNFKKSAFNNVDSRSSLYDRLGSLLGLTSRTEINLAVIRTQELEDILKEAGVYDLLKF